MSREKVKKLKPGRLKKREGRVGYLFVLPWIIGTLLFVIYPLIQSFQYAFYKIKMTPKGRILTPVALKNYLDIWQRDVEFPTALTGYAINTLLAVPVIVVFALIIALLLNSKIRWKGLFRLVFFLPVIIASGPVMGQLAEQGAASIPAMNVTMIYQVLDQYLPGMLAQSITDLFSNMIMILWYSGVQILIFLAAVQKIDTSLYEAAKIDGSSLWEEFWKITLPTIKPMLLLNAVYTVIFLSNNEQNEIIVLIQSAMFDVSRGYGYASAMAWMYAIIVTILVAVVAVLFIVKKDIYEKKAKSFRKMQKRQERALKKTRRKGERYERKNRNKNASLQ
ncbi:carbohydrate ABC transporter permease [Anaeromicropila populeti]|uniref:ABC-type sugar transport system, permease component n=1 Tax=Anaeromicropila populeti TaxID=37658 RepID=A0A1I6LNU5_9FIRM|nr:sugar ABC transporter permease [Anaeromicropila populeti]SFS05207.1 ABC-type sugar transport system, permease component [Anaeromicropila populeti]